MFTCDDIRSVSINRDRSNAGSFHSNRSCSAEENERSFSRGGSKSFRKYSIPEDVEFLGKAMSSVKPWADKQGAPGGGGGARTLPPRGRRSKRRMRLMSMYSDESKRYGDKTQLDDVISEFDEAEIMSVNGYSSNNQSKAQQHLHRKSSENGQLNNNLNNTKTTSTGSEQLDDNTRHKNIHGHDLHSLRIGDLPWGARWLAFTDSVSIVGLRHAVDPQSSNFRRLVWFLFILLGIGFMTYQIYER